jgi:hypothetical protein
MLLPVKTCDAIQQFRTVRALADALGITPQAVYQWGDEVPAGRDFQLEVLTRGALKTSEAHVDDPGGKGVDTPKQAAA